MDGLELFVNQPFIDQLGEDFQNSRLVRRLKSQVRIIKIAEYPKLLELFALEFYVFARIFITKPADLRFAHLAHLLAEFGHHLRFDGQTVTVPAGDIRRIEAGHRLVLDNEILEDLVYNVPHVNIAVGVRRAVVQGI